MSRAFGDSGQRGPVNSSSDGWTDRALPIPRKRRDTLPGVDSRRALLIPSFSPSEAAYTRVRRFENDRNRQQPISIWGRRSRPWQVARTEFLTAYQDWRRLLLDRRAQHAPVCRAGSALARHLEARVAAGEIAISEAERRQRAAEALGIGLVHLEAGLERHAAQRGTDRIGLHLDGTGRQRDKPGRAGAADLDGADHRPVGVDAARASGAVK